MSRFNTRSGDRLRWRVIVSSDGRLDPSRAVRALAWHMVDCADPAAAAAHCARGQQLLADGVDPDGHCLIDGVCARCAEQPEAHA